MLTAIPALPVRDTAAAATHYRDHLGFTIAHQHPGFAKLQRDDIELHLWQADHDHWRHRPDFTSNPVQTGAESFIAGTASCRICVDDIDALYAEMKAANVLHYADAGRPESTAWNTREFAVTDRDNNLLVFYQPV